MAYYNPFQQMPRMPNQQNFGSAQSTYNQQVPHIDPNQFRQFAMTLNDQSIAQLVQMARQRGISDADIQAGINFIKSL
jgi:hypothetical protein